MNSYNENEKVINLLAPQDAVATAKASAYINVANAAGTIRFDIPLGALTTTDTTGEVAITVEASTAGSSNATEAAIAFRYRLSGAVATDSLGDITAATATGVAVSEAGDNKMVHIFVEPSQLAALGADYNWLRVVLTPTADLTATLIGGVIAHFRPRYAQASQPSST
jgi:hypothetical protein